MSARATSWLAWCLWLLCVSLISFALLLYFLASPTPASDTPPALTAFLRVLSLAFPTVGALVASRRPENPIGWIFCGTGLLYGVQAFASGYANYAQLEHTGSLPAEELMAWISGWIGIPILPLAGAVLFGMATMRVHVLPRGGALLIIIGALVYLGIKIVGVGPEWLISVAVAILGAGWAWLGYALWSESGELVQQPERVR